MKKRVPLQVSPEFRIKLKEIQGHLKIKGIDKSIRDITEQLANTNIMEDFKINLTTNIRIRMDKRRR